MDGLDAQKVLLSGASGMLGAAIGRGLTQKGVKVLRLVRREPRGPDEIRWDPDGGGLADASLLEGLSAVVHLSGANVAARRWTAAYKREMWVSRVQSTRVLATALAQLKQPPAALLTASATGFYGSRGDELLDESSAAGMGFFPELCTAWEAAAKPAEEAGIRVVHLRTGFVLSREGGGLPKLLKTFRLGLGGRIGSGRQWMGWIAKEDHVLATLFLLNASTVSGPVNLVAPHPVTNAEFSRELARAVHRPAWFPVPAFGLRLLLGEMADEALLASQRAVPLRLLEAGFQFAHPSLAGALAAVL